MRAILVNNEPYGSNTLKKMFELNFPEVETGTSSSNNTTGRQALQKVRPDVVYQEEELLYKQNDIKTGFPFDMRLCLPTQKGFTIVKLEEIVYCEAQRSYTQFHLLNNKSITVSKPLFDYDKLLTDSIFMRVHKSFLINLLHVKEYTRGEGGTVIMSNSMEIEVSRRKKEQFLIRIKESFKY